MGAIIGQAFFSGLAAKHWKDEFEIRMFYGIPVTLFGRKIECIVVKGINFYIHFSFHYQA